jgi:hypothetical protein
MALTLDDKWDELRNSGVLCCLHLESDYDYVYEVVWCYARGKKHSFHRTVAFDTAQEALDEAYNKIIQSQRWKDCMAKKARV